MPHADVEAAIVIPAYKHPGLMIETLASALAQKTAFPFAVIAVNDGCPYRETDLICREFSRAHERMFYIRQANRGLSGARNAAIEFALSAFDSLRAVQFLDADDCLYPGMLQGLFTALEDGDASVGWSFTDKNEFGFDIFSDLGPRYNPAEHLIRNITPASSMVSVRMLDLGVRCDERMKQGMEDWDFWLQGVALGFRGAHVPAAGLRYRHRGESMSADLPTQGDAIREYMYGKHASLFSPRGLLGHEIRWLPRFAVLTIGSDRVRYVTDPDDVGIDVDLATFHDRLCRSPHRPGAGLLPPFVVILDPAAEAWLAQAGLARTALWNLQRAASHSRFSALLLEQGEDDATAVGYLVPMPVRNVIETCPAGAIGLMIATDAVIAMGPNAPSTPPKDASLPLRSPVTPHLTIHAAKHAAAPSATPNAIADRLRQLVSDLTVRWIGAGLDCWSGAQFDRHRAGPIRPERLYNGPLDVPAMLPLAPGPEPRCAIVIAAAGARADVTAIEAIVERQTRAGWTCHLMVMSGESVACEPPPGLAGLPTLLMPMRMRGGASASLRKSSSFGSSYFGSSFRRTVTDMEAYEDHSFSLGALIGFERVVLIGCEALFLVGSLRRAGAQVLLLADPGTLDEIALGDEGGLASLLGAMAFEHSLTGLLTGDAATASLLKGLGAPDNKVWSIEALA